MPAWPCFLLLMGSVSAPFVVPLCLPQSVKGHKKIDSETRIELTSDTPGAIIFYTLNGRKPNPFEAWQLNSITFQYTEPIKLQGASGLRTIRAVAVDDRLVNSSSVVTKTFYVEDVSPQVPKKPRKCQDPLNQTAGSTVSTNQVAKGENPLEITGNEAVNELDKLNIQKSVVIKEDRDVRKNKIRMDHLKRLDDISEDDLELKSEEARLPGHEESLVQTSYVGDVDRVVDAERFDTLADPDHCQLPDDSNTIKAVQHDFALQCSISNDQLKHDKEIQAMCIKIKTSQAIQASVDSSSKCVQTTFEEPQTLRTSESKGEAAAEVSTTKLTRIDHPIKINQTSQTDIKMDNSTMLHQQTQTDFYPLEDEFVQPKALEKGTNKITNKMKISPGRGFWRQQMDFITSCLKAEAYNNEEFRKNIAEQRITKLNQAFVHENLDDLILVANFALKNPLANFYRKEQLD